MNELMYSISKNKLFMIYFLCLNKAKSKQHNKKNFKYDDIKFAKYYKFKTKPTHRLKRLD